MTLEVNADPKSKVRSRKIRRLPPREIVGAELIMAPNAHTLTDLLFTQNVSTQNRNVLSELWGKNTQHPKVQPITIGDPLKHKQANLNPKPSIPVAKKQNENTKSQDDYFNSFKLNVIIPPSLQKKMDQQKALRKHSSKETELIHRPLLRNDRQDSEKDKCRLDDEGTEDSENLDPSDDISLNGSMPTDLNKMDISENSTKSSLPDAQEQELTGQINIAEDNGISQQEDDCLTQVPESIEKSDAEEKGFKKDPGILTQKEIVETVQVEDKEEGCTRADLALDDVSHQKLDNSTQDDIQERDIDKSIGTKAEETKNDIVLDNVVQQEMDEPIQTKNEEKAADTDSEEDRDNTILDDMIQQDVDEPTHPEIEQKTPGMSLESEAEEEERKDDWTDQVPEDDLPIDLDVHDELMNEVDLIQPSQEEDSIQSNEIHNDMEMVDIKEVISSSLEIKKTKASTKALLENKKHLGLKEEIELEDITDIEDVDSDDFYESFDDEVQDVDDTLKQNITIPKDTTLYNTSSKNLPIKDKSDSLSNSHLTLPSSSPLHYSNSSKEKKEKKERARDYDDIDEIWDRIDSDDSSSSDSSIDEGWLNLNDDDEKDSTFDELYHLMSKPKLQSKPNKVFEVEAWLELSDDNDDEKDDTIERLNSPLSESDLESSNIPKDKTWLELSDIDEEDDNFDRLYRLMSKPKPKQTLEDKVMLENQQLQKTIEIHNHDNDETHPDQINIDLCASHGLKPRLSVKKRRLLTSTWAENGKFRIDIKTIKSGLARKRKLQYKLERPYIIKKKIKSQWTVM